MFQLYSKMSIVYNLFQLGHRFTALVHRCTLAELHCKNVSVSLVPDHARSHFKSNKLPAALISLVICVGDTIELGPNNEVVTHR